MTAPPSPPVPLRIRLPYRSEEEFIERYGTNVARGGIFIATRSLKPEGTLLQFELVLADGTRLLRGEGLVFKTQVDEGGSRSGMTLRFTRLDAQSKALVEKVIAHRSAPATPERAPHPEPHREPEPPMPPPEPAREPAREPAAEPEPRPEPRPPRRVSLPEAPAVAAGPSAPELVLGIDLGMTQSRVAVMIDGEAKLVPLGSETSLSLPSVVALNERDEFLVGARAEAQLRVDPANTAFGWKRLIGRRARSGQVRELAQRLPYKVVADGRGDAAVELRGKAFLLPEVAAQLLGALAAAAQDHVGRPVSKAVLCVPAYFNDRQRTALLEASRLAGLEVLRIINEPSAVALAYGHGRGLARKRVLAFDLGGSTFDVSIVEITGDDLEVVATGGMDLLGGTEFDLLVGADEEQLGASGVERAVEAMRAVLAAANLTPQGIDEVLLVGSQSVAPLVHRRLEDALGRPARSDVDPNGAIALGAAILGEALVRAELGKPGASVSEVLSSPIGIAVKGGGMRKVLDRNTRLPAVKTLALPVKSGAPLGIAVFQGDAPNVEDNEYLGSLRLVAERSGEATLRFRAREDGTLELTARVPGARADVSLDTADTSDEARAGLLANAPPSGEPDQPAQEEGGLLRGLKKLFVRQR